MRSDQEQTRFPELSRGSSHDSGPARRFPEIAGYQILKELPRGGQAMVYQAVHLATKSKVALKVLHPDFHHSAQAKRYFEQEVEFAARLHHPNIVAIRDSGVIKGLYYFAMTYIRGKPLNRYLKTLALSIPDKLILFSKICDAIAHAHQHGVIHRDLKPSNILVDEHSEPQVLDFGLAKSVDAMNHAYGAENAVTLTGEIRGTLAYMAPEQAEGRPNQIDVRTDVYALGVILYRTLTNAFPYDVSGSALNTLQAIQSANPIRPKQVLKKLDADIEAIVLKCLEKAPEQRYQSAAELRDDIRRWMDGLPILARSVNSLYLLRKIVTRHRWASAVLALLCIILIAYGLVCYALYADLRQENLARTTAMESLTLIDQKYTGLARQAALLHMVDWWQRDQLPASPVLEMMGTSTREGIARRFLTDMAPLADKINDLKARLKEDPFFWEFVIAEHYFKQGDRTAARQHYSNCLSETADTTEDQLIRARVHLRLSDLAGQRMSPNALNREEKN